MLRLFGRWGIGQEEQPKEIPIGKEQSTMKVDNSLLGKVNTVVNGELLHDE